MPALFWCFYSAGKLNKLCGNTDYLKSNHKYDDQDSYDIAMAFLIMQCVRWTYLIFFVEKTEFISYDQLLHFRPHRAYIGTNSQ